MRMLHFIGAMTGAASLAAMPASAQAPRTVGPDWESLRGPATSQPRAEAMRQSWGHRVNGRWWGGYEAPGGWAAYRRPVYGFILPGYWLQPRYHISAHGAYGLPIASAGYGWSRYYDDAVLTDRYGRVYDSRPSYDWDRYSDDDGYREDARDDGGRTLAGAAIGGVAGGLLGSAIAGPGSRTGGAILGAGIGAIAGGVIADSGNGRREPRYNGAPSYSYDRWASLDDATRLKSEARQRKAWAKERRKLDKLAREAGYANYDDYARVRDRRAGAYGPAPRQPHWSMRGGPEGGAVITGAQSNSPRIEYETLPGYVANGYYYPGETITTITIEPSKVSTTKTSYVTKPTRVISKPRPRAKPSKLLKR